jgi:hypothetical protein
MHESCFLSLRYQRDMLFSTYLEIFRDQVVPTSYEHLLATRLGHLAWLASCVDVVEEKDSSKRPGIHEV